MQVVGFEAPVLQQPLHDADGLVGYADTYWKQAKLAAEFDGLEKYIRPGFLMAGRPRRRWWRKCSSDTRMPWRYRIFQ